MEIHNPIRRRRELVTEMNTSVITTESDARRPPPLEWADRIQSVVRRRSARHKFPNIPRQYVARKPVEQAEELVRIAPGVVDFGTLDRPQHNLTELRDATEAYTFWSYWGWPARFRNTTYSSLEDIDGNVLRIRDGSGPYDDSEYRIRDFLVQRLLWSVAESEQCMICEYDVHDRIAGSADRDALRLIRVTSIGLKKPQVFFTSDRQLIYWYTGAAA
jgi:hypothetical protein